MRCKYILTLMPLMLLSSCGGGKINPVGTYSFGMGQESGSHFKVSMELTNEVVAPPPSPTNGEEAQIYRGFTFNYQHKAGTAEKETTTLEGGYYVKEDNKLSLDVYFYDGTVLTSDVLDTFLVVTLFHDSLNVNIPVSINDAYEKMIAEWEGRDPEHYHSVDVLLKKE